jgi:ArsR family transcriptional regulator
MKHIEQKKFLNLLQILSEVNRFQIIFLLKKGELCVCEIWQKLGLPQNLVSHHLKILHEAGFLNKKKEGLKVIYSLDNKKLKEYKRLLNKL